MSLDAHVWLDAYCFKLYGHTGVWVNDNIPKAQVIEMLEAAILQAKEEGV